MSWTPETVLTIDGATVDDDQVLEGVVVHRGRHGVDEQAPPGYVNVQLLDLEASMGRVRLDARVSVEVDGVRLVTDADVSDAAVELLEYSAEHDTRVAAHQLRAMGRLARLHRRTGALEALPAQLDGERVAAVLELLALLPWSSAHTWPPTAGSWAEAVDRERARHRDAVLALDPAGYWPLSADDRLVDASGNGSTLTDDDRLEAVADGPLRLDDTGAIRRDRRGHLDTHAAAARVADGSAYTIGVWFRPFEDSAGTRYLYAESPTDSWHTGILWVGDQIRTLHSANDGLLAAWSDPLELGTWHHAVQVYDGAGTVQLYIDGQLADQDSGDGTDLTEPNERVRIGSAGHNDQPLEVDLAHAAAFPYALDAEQVAELHGSGVAPLPWTDLDPTPLEVDAGQYQLAAVDEPGDPLQLLAAAAADGLGVVGELRDGGLRYTDAHGRTARAVADGFLEIPAEAIVPAGLTAAASVGDLANRVRVRYVDTADPDGDRLEVVVDDEQKIADRGGVLELTVDTQLVDPADAQARADRLLELRRLEAAYLDRLLVALDDLEPELRGRLLALEVGTPIRATGLPGALGGTFTGTVEALTWNVSRHTATVELAVSSWALSEFAVPWTALEPLGAWTALDPATIWTQAQELVANG